MCILTQKTDRSQIGKLMADIYTQILFILIIHQLLSIRCKALISTVSTAGGKGKELTKMYLRLRIYPNFTSVSSDNRAPTELATEATTTQCPSPNAHAHTLAHTGIGTHPSTRMSTPTHIQVHTHVSTHTLLSSL